MRMLQLCLSGKASSDTGDQIREKDGSGGEKRKNSRRRRNERFTQCILQPPYPGEGYHFPDYADSSYRTASAAFFGIYNFGFRALVLILISIATCVLTEYIYEKLMKNPSRSAISQQS